MPRTDAERELAGVKAEGVGWRWRILQAAQPHTCVCRLRYRADIELHRLQNQGLA